MDVQVSSPIKAYSVLDSELLGDTGVVCADVYSGSKIELWLSNTGTTNKTITLKTDRDYPQKEVVIGDERTESAGTYFCTFTAPYDVTFELDSELSNFWIYKEGNQGRSFKRDEIYILQEGETIRFGGQAPGSGYTIGIVKVKKIKIIEGAKLGLTDDERVYYFKPTRSGNYCMEQGKPFALRYCGQGFGVENWFSSGSENEEEGLYLDAGEIYRITGWAEAGGSLTIRQDLTVLDYDYYQAFTASGSSVSIGEDGSIKLVDGKSGSVLDRMTALTKNVLKIAGVDTYSSSNADAFAEANLYWKGKSGAFKACEFYKIDENGGLVDVTGQTLSEDDKIIVVRYLPEIVWVDSMTIIAEEEKSTVEEGQKLQLTVNPKTATGKYPFRTEPTIRWESSAPEIAEVNAKTGVVTGKKAGHVTITAYADEALRARYIAKGMNMPEYTSASIELDVTVNGALTELKVTPLSNSLVLPKVPDGKGGYRNGKVISWAGVSAIPSSVSIRKLAINWSIAKTDTSASSNACAIDSEGNYKITEPGFYTITASCMVDGKRISGKAEIEVTEDTVSSTGLKECYKGTLDSWSGEITVPAGESWRFSYTPSRVGGYYVEGSGAVEIRLPENAECYSVGENGTEYIYRGCSLDYYDTPWVDTSGPGILEVSLSNSSSSDVSFVLKTDQDYPEEEIFVGRQNSGSGFYTFTAPYDGIFNIDIRNDHYWIYKESDPGSGWNWDIKMKAGEVLKCGGDDITQAGVTGQKITNVKGAKLKLGGDPVDYFFTPSRSGNYSLGEGKKYSLRYGDIAKDESTVWRSETTEKQDSIYLEAGETYWFYGWVEDGGILTIRQNLTVLDYDYYQAFTASGGSVSVGKDGTITLSGGQAGTVLDRIEALTKNILEVSGIDTYDSSSAEAFAAANQYWKDDKSGVFKAAKYYKISGNGKLVNVTGQTISENDKAIVVRYLPDIVWVDSMNITSDEGKTSIQVGQDLQLIAHPKAATEKYDFTEEPKIRWESSDPEIAEVNEKTGKVTAKKEGRVTITAYADEDLRAIYIAKGMEMQEYTSASIDLNVTAKVVLTGLKVIPESTSLVLPKISDGNGGYKNGVIESCATVQPVPSTVDLSAFDVRWSITGSGNGAQIDEQKGTFRITEPGTYTITATCKVNGKQIVGTADIQVTSEKIAFPLAEGVKLQILKNIEGDKTIEEIENVLTEQLSRNAGKGYTGTFVYTDQNKNPLKENAKLPAVTNTWLVTYVPGENDIYETAETSVKVECGTLAAQVTSEKGDILSASIQGGTKVESSNYPNQTALRIELRYNGKKITQEELSEKELIVEPITISTEKDGILTTDSDKKTVTGLKAGTDTVTIEIPVSLTTLDGTTKTEILKRTIRFTVKDESVRAVKSISVTQRNGSEVPKLIAAEKVADQKLEIPLALNMTDFADVAYDEGKTAWTTSDKSVASVTIAKDGTPTLVIPKKASGMAELTVTAQDYNKASTSFQITVADTDVRILNSTITMNAKTDSEATLQIAPNMLWAESVGIDSENLAVEVFVTTPEQAERFELIGEDGTSNNGSWKGGTLLDTSRGGIGIRYKDPNEKAGRTTLELGIACYDKTKTPNTAAFKAASVITTKKITVVNKPSYPKTTAKVTRNYNTFWNDENADAEVLLVTAAEETASGITLQGNPYFELAGSPELVEGTSNQWKLRLEAKNGVTPKKTTLNFGVEYEGYRAAAAVKATVNVSSQTPAFTVEGYEGNASYYPELGETGSLVVLHIGDGIEAENIALTAPAAKNFELEDILEIGEDAEGYRAVIQLTSKTGKTADVQFVVTSERFSKKNAVVLSKKLKITAKKLSTDKVVLYNATTNETKTSYIMQQTQAGKETLMLRGFWDGCRDVHQYYMAAEAGDAFTAQMIREGSLTVEENEDGIYLIQTEPELFAQKSSSCTLKFTLYAESENGDQEFHAGKSVKIRLNLQKQKQAPNITATVKAKGSLNVVDADSSVVLTPTFKNLPQGAEVVATTFASDADEELYTLQFDSADLPVKASLRAETSDIPLGTQKIGLVYTICESDGSILTIPATAVVNVVQTATVKSSKKTVTLYNGALGASYGDAINITISKPAGAAIRSIEIPELDGILYEANPDNGEVRFYLDSPQLTKSYKTNIIVHLEGAGSRKGKEVTYSIPVTIVVKK